MKQVAYGVMDHDPVVSGTWARLPFAVRPVTCTLHLNGMLGFAWI